MKKIAVAFITSAALSIASSQASECSAEISRDTSGNFQACIVNVSGTEYRMGADQSSEGGCSQVCAIMGAVKTAKKGGRIATAMAE